MGPFSMDYWERGSHARSVYSAQDTQTMETARVKQEEEADTKIMARELKYRKMERGHEVGKVSNKT